MTNQELFQIAERAARSSYAPYSHFHVGAAILTKEGSVVLGCNIENSSYGASICAERVAATKAISEGFREFEAIAVAGFSEEEVTEDGKTKTVWTPKEAMPCGICRQFLVEFSPQMRVITQMENGALRESILEDLLKGYFTL